MQIREVDVRDDDEMAQVAAVAERVSRHERPHAQAFSAASHVAWLRSSESGEQKFLLVALDGDRVLGTGYAFLFLLDNRDVSWMHVEVDPAERRAGVGSALLERLTALVRAEARSVLLVETVVPFEALETHHHRRFLEQRGWSFSNVEVVRHQALPVAGADLDRWDARAAERAAAYRVETFVNQIPEDLQESWGTLVGLLGVDAPTGAVDFEAEVMTPERIAERFATAEAMDRDIFDTVATAPDGTVVAQSSIAVTRSLPDASQWGTYVHRDHRGHSLGLAVKVANLRAVQAAHPHLRRVITQNAETNAWMIAINEEMGYRPVEASLEMVRRL